MRSRWGLLAALMSVVTSAAVAAEVVLARADYPEGPLWFHLRLYYGEMMRDRVMVSADLRTAEPFWRMDGCGPVSIAPYRDDELLVLCHLLHRVVRVSRTGATLGVIETDDTGQRVPYPNDSSADDRGGVYLTSSGTFSLAAPATGAVLYLDRGGRLRRLAGDIRYANGIAVDISRKRLFVSEHLHRRVLEFPLRPDGALGKRSVFFDLKSVEWPHGDLDPLAGPDGLELDDRGRLLVAEYGAGRIHLVAPDGSWVGTVSGLMRYVTDMALLPGDRAAVTEASVNDVPPYPGDVLILDNFRARFRRTSNQRGGR